MREAIAKEIIVHDDDRKYYVTSSWGQGVLDIFKSQYIENGLVKVDLDELEAFKRGVYREKKRKGGKRS